VVDAVGVVGDVLASVAVVDIVMLVVDDLLTVGVVVLGDDVVTLRVAAGGSAGRSTYTTCV
jgi:hypothetical protein